MANAENKIADEVTDAEIVEYTGAGVDVASAIQGLNNPDADYYTSMKNDTFAGRVEVAQALSASKPIADNLGVEFRLKHFIVQSVQIADDDNPEIVNDAPRVTLVDDEGNAFHGTSAGLLSSVRNLLAQLGEPENWEVSPRVHVIEERSRKNYRFMTIKLLGL